MQPFPHRLRFPHIALMIAAAAAIPAAPVRSAVPVQPWRSADGRVALLRPAMASPGRSDRPIGSLMSAGWRLVWDGRSDVPGTMLLRLAIPVVPRDASKSAATEVLQIGASQDSRAVRSCLRFGLSGSAGAVSPDRVINGVRFSVRTNGDAGMSQQIAATDLRAVVGNRCYAVERFTYAVAAGVALSWAVIPQTRGAAALDAALASLVIAATGRARPAP